MDLDCRAVQGHRFDLDADDLSMLQLCEYPIQYTALRPTIHARVDSVPVAEPFRQAAPFAALLGDVQNGVQHPLIGDGHGAALRRQTVLDLAILCFGNFHPPSIS